MQAKHLCFLIHIGDRGEAGATEHVFKPSGNVLADCFGAVLLLLILFCRLCFVFVFVILPCLFMQPCGHLMGKNWSNGPLVCNVILVFCHFPIWCPGSGVVLDCIDS